MIDRYNRQVRYAPFGEAGQQQLMHTHVMVMGAGALGSHIAELLVRMGIGQLTIIDMDIVERSNLHRQALYDEDDAEQLRPKVTALTAKLQRINKEVTVTPLYQELTPTNIEALLTEHQPDVVLDGMDHFEIRYLINEACHKYQIPWIYGAAVGSKGTVYAIDFTGPCLKCVLGTMPETGESCAINGVIPPAIYQVASTEVSELMRFVSGHGFSKKLITLDAFQLRYQTMNIDALKQADCPVCAQGDYELLNQPQQQHLQKLCGRTFLCLFDSTAFDYADYFPGKITKQNDYVKLMRYDDYQLTLFRDGRMNIYGTDDANEAKALYHTFSKALK